MHTTSFNWDTTVEFSQPWYRRSTTARLVPRVSSKTAQVESLVAQYWPTLAPVDEVLELGEGEERHFIFQSRSSHKFFLRRFTGWGDEAELKATLTIQQSLANDIFEVPYARGLRPIRTYAGDLMIKTSVFSDHGAWWYALFPFVEGVRHFEGAQLDELESAAAQFGTVTDSLQRHDPLIQTMHKKLEGISPFNEWFGTLERNLSLATSGTTSIWQLFLHAQAPFITQCMKDAAAVGEPSTWPCIPALFDFEPDNCFVVANECVLIFDYEHIQRRWPEQAVVAFSLHRFCREYVCKDLPRQLGPFAPIKESVSSFLRGYTTSRPAFEISVSELHAWIKLTNLYKLARWVSYSLDATKDPRWRSSDRHREEVLKLLSHLKEADVIRDALAPGHRRVEASADRQQLSPADTGTLVRVIEWLTEQVEFQKSLPEEVADIVERVFQCTAQRQRASVEVGIVRLACLGGLLCDILPSELVGSGSSKRLAQIHQLLTGRKELAAILDCHLPSADNFRSQAQRALRNHHATYGPLLRRDVTVRLADSETLALHVPGTAVATRNRVRQRS